MYVMVRGNRLMGINGVGYKNWNVLLKILKSIIYIIKHNTYYLLNK